MPAKVICGTKESPFFSQYVGKTVGQLRELMESDLEIPEGAPANVTRTDGEVEAVDDSEMIRDGEILEFVRESGRKGPAKIICGTQETPFYQQYVGKTVGELRCLLREDLEIPDGAPANVTRTCGDVEAVDDTEILKDGELLEFVRESGRKGPIEGEFVGAILC